MNHKEIIDIDDSGISNTSGNRPFADVLRASRRRILTGGLAAAATGFLAPATGLARHGRDEGYGKDGSKPWQPLIGFRPVPLPPVAGFGPEPSISDDYEYDVLIPWGTPIRRGIKPYEGDPASRPTAAEQAEMIGIGHDGMWFFPIGRGRLANKLGILCINHEFGDNNHLLGKPAPESLEDVRLSQHAHGVAVVVIGEWHGHWKLLYSRLNRRIHVNTEVAFSGPVAGSSYLENGAANPYLGTVNNCASGYTPWGTYLTCEENFNGYFGATGEWTASEGESRYGFSSGGFGYGWEDYDPRFDLSNPEYRNEQNRFGWVVEIDPKRPWQKPVKRTALGRVKHEGATVVEGQGGRAVVYMGDDERFDYIYRFVSAKNWKSMAAKGQSPLDDGTLYVAKFNDDNTGEWLPLTIDNPALAGRFADQAELLVNTRIAADIVGATPMDRPEWIAVAPNEDVYCTLTNNSRRTVPNGPNPLAPNPDGHILRWRDSHKHTGTTFELDIFLIAADTHGTDESFASPDGIWADPDGRIFIQTDGGQKDGLNNQMLVADSRTGAVSRLLTGVTGDEITGITVTPDRRTLFCNTQHPGDGDPTASNFPAPTDGVTIPRDCTFVVRRKNGGIVGS